MRILVTLVVLNLLLVSCKKKEERRSQEFSYQFKESGCDTEKHTFASNEDYCRGLRNSALNHGCALEARRAQYNLQCAGQGAFQSDESTSRSLPADPGVVGGGAAVNPAVVPAEAPTDPQTVPTGPDSASVSAVAVKAIVEGVISYAPTLSGSTIMVKLDGKLRIADVSPPVEGSLRLQSAESVRIVSPDLVGCTPSMQNISSPDAEGVAGFIFLAIESPDNAHCALPFSQMASSGFTLEFTRVPVGLSVVQEVRLTVSQP